MGMNFNEAASHAKRMKGSFSAFEKLEDVLKIAAQAENAASEAETKHHALVKENAVLGVQVKELQGEKSELETLIHQRKVEAERQASNRMSAVNAKRDAVLRSIEEAVNTAAGAAKTARDKLEGEMSALDRERAAIEGRLSAAQAEITKMKQDVERLADGRV